MLPPPRRLTHRLELENITLRILDARIRQRLDLSIPDRQPGKQPTRLDHKLEDMRQRQKRQVRIGGRQVFVQKVPDGAHGGDNVLVREHDALGCARGPGRVHDAVHVVGIGTHGFLEVGLSEPLDLVNMHDLESLALAAQLVQQRLVCRSIVYDQTNGRTIVNHLDERRQEFRIGEHAAYAGLLERVGETGRTERVVRGADGDGGKGTGVGHDLPVDAACRVVSQ